MCVNEVTREQIDG